MFRIVGVLRAIVTGLLAIFFPFFQSLPREGADPRQAVQREPSEADPTAQDSPETMKGMEDQSVRPDQKESQDQDRKGQLQQLLPKIKKEKDSSSSFCWAPHCMAACSAVCDARNALPAVPGALQTGAGKKKIWPDHWNRLQSCLQFQRRASSQKASH